MLAGVFRRIRINVCTPANKAEFYTFWLMGSKSSSQDSRVLNGPWRAIMLNSSTNRLLDSMSRESREVLAKHMHRVELKERARLEEGNRPVPHVYSSCRASLASLPRP